ncbi:hypothetical protein [Priestia endophytica]|uniref:hypothetical protein n=1 Tax=Priestia endophytica TaxID=135735 RepID=UPI00124C6581|nr:hypothetical protein [Priestia endophytica]KAB2488090.1 hypothetical protein F8155_25480 [Priestia endophytica]
MARQKRSLATDYNNVGNKNPGSKQEENQSNETLTQTKETDIRIVKESQPTASAQGHVKAQTRDVLEEYAEKKARIQRGVYFDIDVWEQLEKLKKKHGKGIISDITNQQVREFLKQKGLL